VSVRSVQEGGARSDASNRACCCYRSMYYSDRSPVIPFRHQTSTVQCQRESRPVHHVWPVSQPMPFCNVSCTPPNADTHGGTIEISKSARLRYIVCRCEALGASVLQVQYLVDIFDNVGRCIRFAYLPYFTLLLFRVETQPRVLQEPLP